MLAVRGMTKTLAALMLALGMTLTGAAQGVQDRPDLSGTWRMDEARSGSPAHEGFVGPVVRTIRQTPDELVVNLTRGTQTMTLSYPLSERAPTRVRGALGSNGGHWDGKRLVTEAFQNIQGQTVTTREICTLDPDSDELIIERVVEVEHGYTIQGAQNYSSVRDVFVRVRQ